jgi:hypothetical protein
VQISEYGVGMLLPDYFESLTAVSGEKWGQSVFFETPTGDLPNV